MRQRSEVPRDRSELVPSPVVVRRLQTAAAWAAGFSVLMGLAVLAGWLLDLPSLTSVFLGLATMKPNTAFGLLLAGGSLALLHREGNSSRIRAGKILAGLVLALGLMTAAEYLFHIDPGFDRWLERASSADGVNPFPARMSPLSVICFVATGLGLLLLDSRRASVARIAEIATMTALVAALLGLIGYAYGVSALYRIGPFNALAIPTAVTFLVLGLGILAARPERGLASLLTRQTSGSLLVRRLLLPALILPLALGWLRVRAEQAGYFQLPFGTALLVTALVVIFVALIWSTAVSLDRTDRARQQTENALRDSEQRYRSLFEAIDEGFCVIEVLFDENQSPVDYRFLEINPAFERHTGLEGAAGKRMRELVPDQDAHWFETYGRVALTGEAIRFENHSEPMQRWFDVHASRVGRPEERKVAVLFTNTTDGKRAEAALQRLAAIVESSECAIVSKDLNGVITTWNPGGERLLGYTAEEAVGQPVTLLIPAERIGEESGILERIRRGETFENYETVRRHKNGALVHVSLTVSPIKDSNGRVTGASKIMHDVTAQKRAQLELAEKMRLLDLSNDAIIARDPENKVIFWNKGAEKLYGWTTEEAVGRDLHGMLQTEFPKPREEIVAELQRVGEFQGEVWQIARNGRRIPSLCRWVLDRKTGSILTSYTDLTASRALDSALAAHAAHLLRENRSKDEFLAMLAHELRNPLAPLRNAAEILQAPDVTADEREQALKIFSRQITNMSRMIDDLLDVSRITERKIELRAKPVALETILNAALDLVRPNCVARNQHLAVSMPAGPIYVHADATRLEQVFVNLLSNASKYSGDGCHIALRAERTEHADAPGVVVSVRDDGAGIDAELLPRVFDLFVQSSRTLDRSHGGLGIGLTLAARLVELHGGSIEAHSDGPGKGSEFIVRLPRVSQGPPPAAPEAAPVPGGRERSRRILIVDDNMDSARSMARLQAKRGHETRTAFDGPTALAAAAEFLPQVVLLDIGLPGMDGYEVARQLRRTPGGAGILLIAMTGYASPEDRRAAKEAGFDEHLAKPVDLEALHEWLRTRT